MRVLSLSAGLLLWAVTLHGQANSNKDTALTWGPAPAVFPTGAKMAVVSGDPIKAEMFTIEPLMPKGYKISPHFHPTEESMRSRRERSSWGWEIRWTWRRPSHEGRCEGVHTR